jgi:hypothetical protein
LYLNGGRLLLLPFFRDQGQGQDASPWKLTSHKSQRPKISYRPIEAARGKLCRTFLKLFAAPVVASRRRIIY